MNWTGGRLQRHSYRGQNSVLQRQKQHFAKARTRLRHTPQPQSLPFQPSFLRSDPTTLIGGVTPFGDGSQRHTGHSKGRQTKLEDFESTKRLATRLSRLERQRSIQRASFEQSDVKDASNSRYLSPLQNEDELYDDPPLRHQRPQAHIELHESQPAEQLSRRSKHSSSRRSRTHESTKTELELLEANRRRLLAQNDWAGLGPSRPVQMDYRPDVDKERMGKRRKLGRKDRPRNPTDNSVGPLPVEQDPKRSLLKAKTRYDKNKPKLPRIQIRVGIGALSTQQSYAPTPSQHRPPEVEIFRSVHASPHSKEVIEISETSSSSKGSQSSVNIPENEVPVQLQRSSSMLLDNEGDHIIEPIAEDLEAEHCQQCHYIGIKRLAEQAGFADSRVHIHLVHSTPAPVSTSSRRYVSPPSRTVTMDDVLPLSPETHFRRVFQTRSSWLPETPTPARNGRPLELQSDVGEYVEDSGDSERREADEENWRRLLSLRSEPSTHTTQTGYLGLPGQAREAEQTTEYTDEFINENGANQPNSPSWQAGLAILTNDEFSVENGRATGNIYKDKGALHLPPATLLGQTTFPGDPIGIQKGNEQSTRRDPDELWKSFVFGDLASDDDMVEFTTRPAIVNDTKITDPEGSKTTFETPVTTMQLSSELALGGSTSGLSSLSHVERRLGRDLPSASMINHAPSTAALGSERPEVTKFRDRHRVKNHKTPTADDSDISDCQCSLRNVPLNPAVIFGRQQQSLIPTRPPVP